MSFPLASHIYAFETESLVSQRFLQILLAGDGSFSRGDGQNEGNLFCLENREKNSIVYSSECIEKLPSEVRKYISRVFFLPFTCRDLGWLRYHPSLNKLVTQTNVCFAIKTSPREIGELVINSLSCKECVSINESIESGRRNKLQCSPYCKCYVKSACDFRSSEKFATHVLHVVYSGEDQGLFRWGLLPAQSQSDVSKTEICTDISSSSCSISSLISSTQLLQNNNKQEMPPVCRAYHKLNEVLDVQFPRLQWEYELESLSVDVGASPGGWTQVLSYSNFRVIAIDPGALDPSVLDLPNIRYVPFLCEAKQCSDAIAEECQKNGRITVAVCDVNCRVQDAARLLVIHILPSMLTWTTGTTTATKKDTTFPLVSYLIFTLKLFKNPKSHHVTQAIEVALGEISSCVQKFTGCQHVGVFEWKVNKMQHTSTKPKIVWECIHLLANSQNERTLLVRIETLSPI